MKCPKCGKDLPDNAANCKKCGAVFKENKGNAEMDAYLKKEKEKAAKLNQKKSSKKSKKSKINIKAVIAIAVAVAVLGVGVFLLFYFDIIGGRGHRVDSEEKGPLSIEYTFEQVSDEDAVMKLGDINISVGEYEFFYRQSYSTVQNTAQLSFKDYMSKKLGDNFVDGTDYYTEYFDEFLKEKPNTFDYTEPIDSQETKALDSETGKEISWEEYIRQDAVKTMIGYRVKFELANEMKLELTDDVRFQVYDHIEGLRTAVLEGGYPTLDQYLKILFGDACDEEFFKNELIREYMATKYDSAISNKLMAEKSDAEIKSIYEADYKKYDFADLYVYEVEGAKALETAQKIAGETTDLSTFSAAITSNIGEGAQSQSYPAVPKYYIDANYSKELSNWAFDRERKEGDISVFKTQKGYTVVYVLFPAYTKKDCLSYREIVFNKADTNGKFYTEEELKGIREKAENIYKEWEDGEATEDTFAYFAMSESQGNNASSGGLTAGAVAGEMTDDAFKAWLTEDGRKSGDTTVVETDNAIRIAYFVKGYGDYWNYSIRSSQASEKVSADFENAKNQTYKVNFDASSLEDLESDFISNISRIYLGR